MKTTQDIKAEIKSALLAQKPSISIAHYNAEALFEQVLAENPALALQVDQISTTTSFWGLTVSVTYNNDEVPQHVSRASTDREFEQALHDCVRKYVSKAVIISKPSVNVMNVYSDFYTAYNGYYSNLTAINLSQSTYFGGEENWTTVTFKYRIGRLRLSMMERVVNDKVAQLQGQLFAPTMSKQAKAYVAHNYLAATVEYWNKKDATPLETSYMQSAYGALINNRCVCQGYAEAYKRLLDAAGVTCEVICGKIRNSKEYHAWNVVSFDNKNYYHVDVTWDSGGGCVGVKYYGLNDAELSKTRIWTRPSHIICNVGEDILRTAKQDISTRASQYLARGIDKKYLGM